MRNLVIVFLVLCLASGALQAQVKTRTEIGTLGDAEFRIAIPANWNHKLVMLCHGYSMKRGFGEHDADLAKPFVDAGYAVAQSAYSTSGWAVKEASEDTETLRKYFVGKYGAPQQTLVSGDSMGGLVTVLLMERSPHEYAAGLSLCGALDDSLSMIKHHVFDVRVVFDHYYPGKFAQLDSMSPSKQFRKVDVAKLAVEMSLKPSAEEYLRRMVGAQSTIELAGVIEFWTFLLDELHTRAGGNAFDNRNTLYSGGPDDIALNKGVRRYAADAGALDYLKKYYTPTGDLAGPLLAIHTMHDPVVQPSVPDGYNLTVARAGKEDLFAEQVVNESGHCEFKPDEISNAIAEWEKWIGSGVKPLPGVLSRPR